ncbi:MAG TPA: IS630 family transposase, partial [Candidatus Paceibacterota bacterium]|nr:IS630 family transposase [Candidatus Paceibacterota bacterium]
KARKIPGRPPRLSGVQIRWIYETVTMKNPQQLKFPFALWTRGMVGVLIRRQFGVRLASNSVGRLLAKLGLSCQRPLYRAYQQNPALVESWLKNEFPAIRKLAKECNAEVFFGDEAGIRSDYHSGTTWARKGQTPVVTSTGARFGLNMMSAVSSRGLMRFMIIEGRINGSRVCEFLRRLIDGAHRPIFVILDGHPAHRAKMVRDYVDLQKGRLRLFFLPPYAPEVNPDEFVWRHVKGHGVGRETLTGPDDLRAKVLRHLRSLQKRPGIVRSFFQTKTTKYAA